LFVTFTAPCALLTPMAGL